MATDFFREHCLMGLLPAVADLLEDNSAASSISDVELMAEDGIGIPCFKVLLASCSPMLESVLHEADAVVVQGVATEALRRCLHALVQTDASSLHNDAELEMILQMLGVATNVDQVESIEEDKTRSKLFVCDVCLKEYRNEQSFAKHSAAHKVRQAPVDLEERLLSAEVDRPRRQTTRPKRFSEGSDDGSTFRCGTCAERFEESSELEAHEKQHLRENVVSVKRSTPRKGFVCEKCRKCFSSKQALTNHCLLHSNTRNFICDICQKSFVTSGALKTHRQLHTGTASRFPCDHCGKQFNNASNLLRHVRAVHFEHSDGKRLPCPTCGKMFTDPSGLEAHRKIHDGVKKYECNTCGKHFLAAGQLRVHMRIHANQKPYSCSTCGKSFRTNGQLKSHTLHRHVGVTQPRTHLCNDCGVTFIKAYDLKMHMLKHTGELPFVCNQCNKGFRSARLLKDHDRTHSGERPYMCLNCPKSFRAPGGLRKHYLKSDACRERSQSDKSADLNSAIVYIKTDGVSSALIASDDMAEIVSVETTDLVMDTEVGSS